MRLKQLIKKRKKELEVALKEDLRKSSLESYASEIGCIYFSIDHICKHLKK